MQKKVIIIFSLIITLCLGILIGYVIKKDTVLECPQYEYEGDLFKEEYLKMEDQKVYLYNLHELYLNIDNKKITLKEYLSNNTFDSLTNYLELKQTLRDGGTKIYVSKNKDLFNKDVTIIACNTTLGNKDYYFGVEYNQVEAFNNGACGKNFFDEQEFTRNYTIKKITKIKDNLYEIKISDGEKTVTIERTLSKESKEILKENTEFIFYFYNKYKELVRDDIEDVFAKCELTGVVPK